MNCETFDALLLKQMEGSLSPEEAAQMQAHAQQCAACAARQRETDALLNELSDLREAELPLPEGFHSGWMNQVKEAAATMENNSVPSRRNTRRFARFLTTAAAVVVLIGGTILSREELSGTTQSKDAGVPRLQVEYSAGETEDFAAYEAGNGVANSAFRSGKQTASSTSQMKVIRTASLTLGTRRFAEDLSALQALCAQHRGWVSYISQSGEAALAERYASLTMRIPVDELDAFLTGAEGCGRVIDHSETAKDVTESYQDTAARLKTQQAKMERLQAMVSETATLTELLELEEAIADTQYMLDSLQGQLQHTDDQVEHATVSVYLKEETSAETVSAREKGLGERLKAGLRVGFESFWSFVKDMLVFISAALPYAAIGAALWILVRLIRRGKGNERRK